MSFFKSLFSTSLYPNSQALVDQFLKESGMLQRGELNISYRFILTQKINKGQNHILFFKELVHRISKLRTMHSTMKVLTGLHSILIDREYEKNEIQTLEDICAPELALGDKDKWFHQFLCSYVTYLGKVASSGDLFQRAHRCQSKAVEKKFHLTDLFRILNQVCVLFPSSINASNTVGRYYMSSTPEFPDMYRTLNSEVTMLYVYMKHIVDKLLNQYKKYESKELHCFMKSIPEIELACDQMEDFLMNKYFRGKGLSKKIVFNEQKVAEIAYYLEYEVNTNDTKGSFRK